MKLATRIAFRHLRSRHSFGFISFSTIFSIVGLILGVSSLIIISCISSGFSEMVNFKLSGIDGHMRIRSFMQKSIPMNTLVELDKNLYKISENISATAPYIEKHAVLRKGSITAGIILFGVPEVSLDNIFQLKNFTFEGSYFTNEQSIIIGTKLAQSLNVHIGDKIMIMNIEKIKRDKVLEAQYLTVASTFKTDFPEYDRMLAFIPIKTADVFFEMDNHATGLILNVNNPENIDDTVREISEEYILQPYITSTWKERHSDLLEWLTLYDIPIKLVMIFITIVGVFNIAASLWMIIIEKTMDFGILTSMGFSKNNIIQLIMKEGVIIGLAGAIGGIIFSAVILYLQKTYHIIRLPNDIYFMDHLPVQINLQYFIIYPFLSFLITLIFSYIPASQAARISPSKALRYE